MSLVSAAGSGDRLEALECLRGVLSAAIDECDSSRDLASLALRFQSVVAEIDELSGGGGSLSAADEIAERRRMRLA